MKRENFFQMLRNVFYPSFHFFSFTFLLIFLHFSIFLLCILSEGVSKETNDFLPITQEALLKFGEKYPYFIIKEQEYWRLLTNPFLTGNFYQLLSIFLTLLIIGSYLEKKLGFLDYFLLFVFTSLSTSIQSASLLDFPNVGGSFFSFGLFGCIFVLAIYYQVLEVRGFLRENEWIERLQFPKKFAKEFQYLLYAMCVIDLLIGLTNRNIDTCGNGLAVFNGCFMGWCLRESEMKGWRIFRRLSPFIIVSGEFITFLLFRNPRIF